jgi:hypothetical protein
MLTVAFAARLQPYGVTVNACHQGDVNSRLSDDLGFGGQATPDEGASTAVWLATDPIGQRETGKCVEQRRAVCCRFGADTAGVKALKRAWPTLGASLLVFPSIWLVTSRQCPGGEARYPGRSFIGHAWGAGH